MGRSHISVELISRVTGGQSNCLLVNVIWGCGTNSILEGVGNWV
jgi:hypothetical protein